MDETTKTCDPRMIHFCSGGSCKEKADPSVKGKGGKECWQVYLKYAVSMWLGLPDYEREVTFIRLEIWNKIHQSVLLAKCVYLKEGNRSRHWPWSREFTVLIHVVLEHPSGLPPSYFLLYLCVIGVREEQTRTKEANNPKWLRAGWNFTASLCTHLLMKPKHKRSVLITWRCTN